LKAFGFPTVSLTPRADGKLRNGALESVNKLLERIGAPFTASEMRDVGV
jgi:hypothetical protein